MNRDEILTYADHVGRFYARRYGFPPAAGRLIGYLSVCEPMEQPINDIAEALLTSRSAINNAVRMLETQHLIHRSRPAGTRADLISFSLPSAKNMGFDPGEYQEMASLAREGLELLKDASPERRQPLELAASLNEFMVEKLPQLYEEWSERCKKSQITPK